MLFKLNGLMYSEQMVSIIGVPAVFQESQEL